MGVGGVGRMSSSTTTERGGGGRSATATATATTTTTATATAAATTTTMTTTTSRTWVVSLGAWSELVCGLRFRRGARAVDQSDGTTDH